MNIPQGARGSLPQLSERARRQQEQSHGRTRSTPLIQAVNTLARSPLFQGLGDQDIARLNARCVWRRIRAGEFLVDEPADGYALSVVANARR
jgi:hypothetical protein